MGGSPRHQEEWKKPDTNDDMLCEPMYVRLRARQRSNHRDLRSSRDVLRLDLGRVCERGTVQAHHAVCFRSVHTTTCKYRHT